MLQEKYDPKNVTIFNMDDIILEALEYVTPKKADESAVDPKGK